MSLQITLTPVEVSALELIRTKDESVEDVVHRLISPTVQDGAEKRLQQLADAYRSLPPDKQLELVQQARSLSKTPTLIEPK